MGDMDFLKTAIFDDMPLSRAYRSNEVVEAKVLYVDSSLDGVWSKRHL